MLYQSLGNLVDYTTIENGLECRTAKHRVKLLFYTESVLRISISGKDDVSINFSYAVCVNPLKNNFTVSENNEVISLVTNSFKVEINKKPLRIKCLSLDNAIINEDEPAFGSGFIGNEVITHKKLQDNERFLGLGEKTGPLDRAGQAYQNWNTDYFAYPTDADPLYKTIPFYIGVHSGLKYGIFFDNTAKNYFNFGASNHRFSSFSADCGEMDYYFIYGCNVGDIISQYCWLTGKPSLPPKWALGFQQCRYSYYPDTTVLNVAQNFRNRKIPCDVLYFDIHYMDEYRVFSWNKERFPNPKKMINELGEMGFKTVSIIDPGVKQDENYDVYKSGKSEDAFVKYPDGEEYVADVWPGQCVFPDFTKVSVRNWWGSLYKKHLDEGIDGFWNDMNEPASWGQATPNLIEFDFDGQLCTHKKARNVYGMQMARSTYEGVQKLQANKRPFVLTRAAYSGIQRYAFAWTGDNTATDEHMLTGVRLLNSLGVSGVAFSGYDVGGFCGDASPELFARWISVGAFSPMFRAHSMINSQAAEPWSFGEKVEEISRNYINLRYKLMPYIYSHFYGATQSGLPVQQSLAIGYTDDGNIYKSEFENQYLFGDSILICPVESNKTISKVYLPKGDWYYLFNDKKYTSGEHFIECPIERLPIFVKAGAILPTSSIVQNTYEATDSCLYLHLYNGGQKQFCLYEDDGISNAYENGMFRKQNIVWDAKNLKLDIECVEGNYPSNFDRVKIILHGFDKATSIVFNGDIVELTKSSYGWVAPISNFDPFFTENDNSQLEANVFTGESKLF